MDVRVRRAVLLSVAFITSFVTAIACSTDYGSDNPGGPAATDAGDESCVSCNEGGALDSSGADGEAGAGNRVEELSAGGDSVCGRRTNGTVVCWGRNDKGQTGQPPEGDLACDAAHRCRPTPTEVPGLKDVTHVSVGNGFACARSTDGVVKCWGDNTSGQLSTMAPSSFAPQIVPGLPAALDVEAGFVNACARVVEPGKAAIEVYCWGSNRRGVVGTLPAETLSGPTKIAGLTGAKKVALGAQVETACTIGADDTIKCWGRNVAGVLGHSPGEQGDVICSPNGEYCNHTAHPAGGLVLRARDLAVGLYASCALTLNATVECWGYNGYGALGQNSNDATEHALPVVVPLNGPATALAMRHHHACAVVGGVVRCWGANPHGELANNNASDNCIASMHPCKTTPQTTTGLKDVVRIATGTFFSVATTADGRDWAWGYNGDGRLGHAPGTSGDLGSCSAGFNRCNPNPQPVTFP